jgi:hypothetical protein
VRNYHCFLEDDDDNDDDIMFYKFTLADSTQVHRRKHSNVFYNSVTLDSIRHTFTNKVSAMRIEVDSPLNVIVGAQHFLDEHKPTLYIQISEKELKETERLLNRLNYVLLERVGNSNYLFYYM